MLFVADVGNTETTLGLFDGLRLRAQWRIMTETPRTPDEYALLVRGLLDGDGVHPTQLTGVAIGSVVPGVTTPLRDGVAKLTGARVMVIDATSPLPIRLDVEEPRGVGADRVINTLAASRLYARDCIVVDLGTATTFDCITADGVFLGGVIAPGVRTSAETLFRRTAKLSATELEAPESVIGRRTEQAIRAGIVFGNADMIDGIVRRLKAAWPTSTEPYVVGTGGLAGVLQPHCLSIEIVVPELTLVGLRLAWDHLTGPLGPVS
jgi:type III pantothenate kinase